MFSCRTMGMASMKTDYKIKHPALKSEFSKSMSSLGKT